ncbi:cupin domain-containing protein [Halomarina oriensis]|uniref:Cupin domain-containing protein n=1 Tax=Halomarina oriensis TaxID=671145 RepID=A0A6B0GP06_9EURY|nr:cupin domain-containing protein [Halomarina oriensis]MWG35701.1 cupin domain-containing protein [Halomarina oriensis]
MGYEHVRVDELPDAPNPTRHKKEVDEAVDATAFGFNVLTADPGEQLPWGYHRHPDHEELFYVISGTVAFETPDREYRVDAGTAFFVEPDSPQKGVAVGPDPAVVVATGAPKRSDDTTVEEECPACGETTDRTHEEAVEDGRRVYRLRCTDCGEQVGTLRPGP